MPKILLVGQDVSLLETRAEVLKKTGADVDYCTASKVLATLASELPNLVVLCHSLTEHEAEAIADKVHACSPKTRVLLVVSQVTEEKHYQGPKFDGTSLPGPLRLIQRAGERLEDCPITA